MEHDTPTVCFERATGTDLDALCLAATAAFEYDIHYGAPGVGGPPGYNTTSWHRELMARAAAYYKVVEDGRILGGFTVFGMGSGLYILGTIYLVPEAQNRGIGTRAMRFALSRYPQARRWRLDTPAWSQRNHHFCEKLGFRKVAVEVHGEGDESFVYELTSSR